MPRDIRNIERGACIEGCRSCPNFLSVEPGRILCDYCGCPPTKHEIIESHSLMAIEDHAKCGLSFEHSKQIDKVDELKKDGHCFQASRTASNDSGCYISTSSFESPSTSTSTSSCSPYISEEEVEGVDECFASEDENSYVDSVSNNSMPKEHDTSLQQSKLNPDCSAGVYNCSSTEMIVKIRTLQKIEDQIDHAALVNPSSWNTSHLMCENCDVKNEDPAETQNMQNKSDKAYHPTHRICKRKAKKSFIIKDDEHLLKNHDNVCTQHANTVIDEDGSIEENSTLQGMGQLEIGDESTAMPEYVRDKINNGEKIIRAEGSNDVSDHCRKAMNEPIEIGRRSEYESLNYFLKNDKFRCVLILIGFYELIALIVGWMI